MKYPVRARIIDVVGKKFGIYDLKTPEISFPHIGKEGIAEEIEIPLDEEELQTAIDAGLEEKHIRLLQKNHTSVRITLDDGNILWGYECWWEPIY